MTILSVGGGLVSFCTVNSEGRVRNSDHGSMKKEGAGWVLGAQSSLRSSVRSWSRPWPRARVGRSGIADHFFGVGHLKEDIFQVSRSAVVELIELTLEDQLAVMQNANARCDFLRDAQ